MFTGIISELATLSSIIKIKDVRYSFQISSNTDNLKIGSSISCNGVCLTIVKKRRNFFDVDISKETLTITNLSFLKLGEKINIERSLNLGEELGGHIVTGHIDGQCELYKIISIEGSFKLILKTNNELLPMIASKGSIAIDGISLTVNEVFDYGFSVNIIPHTWEKTNLTYRNEGEKLNIEIDIISRYVKRALNNFK